MIDCKFCGMKSNYFPKCRLCGKYVCIQHYTVVVDKSDQSGLACECVACFGNHPESHPERAVGWQ